VREWQYDIPNGNHSYEEWQRAFSLDLPLLTDAELRREARAVQRRLDCESAGTACNWLIERLAAIRRGLRQREGGR
jgi:hypothetical protein